MSSLLTPMLLSTLCVAPVAVDEFCSCKHTRYAHTYVCTGWLANKWRKGTKHHKTLRAGPRTVQETELPRLFFSIND